MTVLGVLSLYFKDEIGILTCVKGGDVDENCLAKYWFQVMWIEGSPLNLKLVMLGYELSCLYITC